MDQIVDDTLAVTDYLQRRFEVPKIYLMGHSWGSFIGIQAAARAPQRYHAYIGVGQLCRQLQSEAEAYAYLLEELPRRGHTRLARKVAATAPPTGIPLSRAYLRVRDPAMHQLGVGTTRDMRSVFTGVFLQVWRTRAYTVREKIDLWRGKWSPWSTAMWNEMLAADLVRTIPRLEVPVHLFHGPPRPHLLPPPGPGVLRPARRPCQGLLHLPRVRAQPRLRGARARTLPPHDRRPPRHRRTLRHSDHDPQLTDHSRRSRSWHSGRGG